MKKRPNIIFFFTDDQRFDTIRALGNNQIHTPNIDKLVERGTVFLNAYIMGGTCGAVCMPSRAMVHTGRSLFHIQGEGQDIDPAHVMLGETLRRAGYVTHGIGKWHNERKAYARSFTSGAEIFFGGMSDHWNVPLHDFDPTELYESRLKYCPDPFHSNEVKERDCNHMHSGKHSTDIFCDAAVEFLKKHKATKPFFMYFAFMAPHDPRTMPKQYLDMYDPAKIDLPENFMPIHPFDNGHLDGRDENLEKKPRQPDAIRKHIAEYYAMITHLDAAIGRIMQVLEQAGQLDNTIIVFAGDNGLALGQHGLMGKQNVYDHSVHVPLIFAGPGVPKGKKTEAFAYLLDIYPTLCELIGEKIPPSVEGKSLVPVMKDDSQVRDHLYYAFMNIHRSIRDKRYKLNEYVVKGQRTTQLFDMQDDPKETKNLADEPAHKDILQKLRKKLIEMRMELDDNRPKEADFWRDYH